MKLCLSQQETLKLLEHCMTGCTIEEESLASLIVLAENWSQSIGALTYLMARIVENDMPEEKNIQLLRCFFDLPETMYLEIQELDIEFINYLVKTLRDPTNTLDEELINLQDKLLRHDYGVVRY